MRATAGAIEQIDAQRIERQIEGDFEIRRQIGTGDLQSVRLEVVDQQLAEAAFLAQCLLGTRGTAGDFVVSAGLEPDCLVVADVAASVAERSTSPSWRRNSPSSPIVTITPATARSFWL
jgi:hypothetical protein